MSIEAITKDGRVNMNLCTITCGPTWMRGAKVKNVRGPDKKPRKRKPNT